MARTIPDAHRSLARYIATILPDFDVWRLRTQPQEDRPYAVVKPLQAPMLANSRKQIVDITQTFITYIYPEVAATALEGQARKLQIEEALVQAFFVANAARVPMYDYSTGGPGGAPIPDDQPGPALPTVSATLSDGTPAGHDYMRVVNNPQLNSAQDAADERRWSITLTLRLAWRRHGQLISGLPVVSVTTKPSTIRG